MRKILFVVALMASSLAASAQDVLVRKNGDVENVKVLEVTPTEVKYKKASNPDGPTFSDKRSGLISVKYANGEIQKFNENAVQSNASSTNIVTPADNSNYNRIFFGYAQTKFSTDFISESLHGFSAGWLGGFNVTPAKKLPLYLETGIALNTGFGEIDPTYSTSDKLLNLEVPINVTYRYNIPNTKIRLSPYFGFHFKVNVLARGTYEDYYYGSESFNYFDGDEFGTKRFQFGMQLGANFEYSHFYIGVGWNKDFMPFMDIKQSKKVSYKVNTSGARVNIGFVF